MTDPDAQRAEILDRWERAAAGWSRGADRLREWSMPVSARLVEHLALQPGYTVLELAAGPGDTGFMAAELIRPGGVLISSDAAETMVEVARSRAAGLGVENVEFRRLELEWIDLPTASVDAALCRWGVTFAVDPSAALREIRRVLRPGGRVAVAAWDVPERNPWATLVTQVLVERGMAEAPDPGAPGMFTFSAPGRLVELLDDAGFTEVEVDAVAIERSYSDVEAYIEDALDLSRPFADVVQRLSEDRREQLAGAIAARLEPYWDGGTFRLPGRSLAAAAGA